MGLSSSGMKSKFKKRIYNGLKREFSGAAAKGAGFPDVADEFWEKLASAVADIAEDLVDELQSNAQVAPGIPLGPGVTGGPGKIT